MLQFEAPRLRRLVEEASLARADLAEEGFSISPTSFARWCGEGTVRTYQDEQLRLLIDILARYLGRKPANVSEAIRCRTIPHHRSTEALVKYYQDFGLTRGGA